MFQILWKEIYNYLLINYWQKCKLMLSDDEGQGSLICLSMGAQTIGHDWATELTDWRLNEVSLPHRVCKELIKPQVKICKTLILYSAYKVNSRVMIYSLDVLLDVLVYIVTLLISLLCKMPGWMKHKLESRFSGEISITSDVRMTPPLWQKAKRN